MMNNQTMKAWRLSELGGELKLKTIPIPALKARSILVRIEASTLMSYLKNYVEGALPFYNPPKGEFTIGTNGVGTVEAIGKDIWHIKPGQRVIISPHFVSKENVIDPGQILIGLTADTASELTLASWPNGTLAEYAMLPVESVTPIEGLEHIKSHTLAALSRFVIPYGGLLKGRLAAGESMVVTGATGAYGLASVLLGVAMGASRIIATGRNRKKLEMIEKLKLPRVKTVLLQGDVTLDSQAIKAQAEYGIDLAFDMVGNANNADATLSALHSLKKGGRLVLMGSMTVDLPIPYTQVMLNSWEILGQFMHPANAYASLLNLVRSNQLDISLISPRIYSFSDLPKAMEQALIANNQEYVIVQPHTVTQ